MNKPYISLSISLSLLVMMFCRAVKASSRRAFSLVRRRSDSFSAAVFLSFATMICCRSSSRSFSCLSSLTLSVSLSFRMRCLSIYYISKYHIPVCMFIHIKIYIYIYIHMCVCIYLYIYIYIYYYYVYIS